MTGQPKKRKQAFWDEQAENIRRMARTMTDTAIGLVYGVSACYICAQRKRLKIGKTYKPMSGKMGRDNLNAPFLPIIPLVGETYIDAEGLKITRYPARTASGADRQSDMVYPSRRK